MMYELSILLCWRRSAKLENINDLSVGCFKTNTDKKEKEIFLIHKLIHVIIHT